MLLFARGGILLFKHYTMTYTNDWKENNIDGLFEWVGDNKFDEINFYVGGASKENYAQEVEEYIESEPAGLWEEYIATLNIN